MTATVEENGPLRAVIRIEAPAKAILRPNPGQLIDQTHGFAVRIYAYAGKPYVKVDYQLENSAKARDATSVAQLRSWLMYFKKLDLNFNLNLDATSRQVLFGTQGSSVSVNTSSGYLAQDVTDGAPNTDRQFRFQVFNDLTGTNAVTAGQKSDGWIDVRDSQWGVAAMTRNFWETWPNGLAFNGNKLSVELWPEWSAEWDNEQISPTNLYWLEDMQHTYKETLFFFHGPGTPANNLTALAKTFQYHPVAVLPADWYRQTKATIDLDGVIPSTQPGPDKREPDYSNEANESNSTSYTLSWNNFRADPDRRQARTAGGFAYGGSAFIESENPSDYFVAEDSAMGELNARPEWFANYRSGVDSYLGLQQGYDAHSWRRSGGAVNKNEFDPYPGTSKNHYDARDDQHAWFYHVEDAYYFTANPWIKDWYSFIKEFRRPGLSSGVGANYITRAMGHMLGNALQAYRVVGDPDGTFLPAIGNFILRAQSAVSPIYGTHRFDPRQDGTVDDNTDSGFELGYLTRSVFGYLREIEGNNPQAYAEVFNYLSGLMEANRNYVNFGFEALLDHSEIEQRPGIECSSGSSHIMSDTEALYYLHTGLPEYRAHDVTYLTSGFPGYHFDVNRYNSDRSNHISTAPYYGVCGGNRPYNDPSNWRSEGEEGGSRQRFLGRLAQYLLETIRPDATSPARINDLRAVVNGTTATLTWTAPADTDITNGRYHIVWATKPISAVTTEDPTKLNWWAAKAVGPNLIPQPGVSQSWTIQNVSQPFYAAIFTFDDSDNMSAMSRDTRSEISWDFTTDAEGWTPIFNLSPLIVSSGVLETQSTASDPQLQSPTLLSLDAARANTVEVKMRVSGSGSGSGQIFFRRESDPLYTSANSSVFPLIRDGVFHVYRVNMAALATWNGIIDLIRFDPIAGSGVIIDIDYIHVYQTVIPPAPTSLTLVQSAPTAVRLHWADNADNEDGFQVQGSLDGIRFLNAATLAPNIVLAPSGMAFTVTGLTPGATYYFRIHAFNAVGGSDSNVLPVTTPGTGDSQAPTSPSNHTSVAASPTATNLAWGASTDNVAVAGYRVDIATDNAFLNMISGWNDQNVGNVLSVSATGLNPGTTYYSQVRAYDAAGNVSANSQTASVTLGGGGDSQAPTITLTAPPVNDIVSDVVTIMASATDNVGVVGVQFLLDGINLGVEVTLPSIPPSTYTIDWDTRVVADGAHTLSAQARDAAGNTTLSALVPVVVSNGSVTPPPVATISAQPQTINRGEGTNLAWSTTNAASVTITPGLGSVAPSGSTSVNPVTTTTYTITATGAGGTDTASVAVTVVISSAFSIGDRVATNNITNVRGTPNGNPFPQPQPVGALGIVRGTSADNPIFAGTHWWWNIDYDTGFDGWSAEELLILVTPPPNAPSAPTNLVATSLSTSQIGLVWQDTATTEDGFEVERGTDGITFNYVAETSSNFTNFTDAALSSGTRYYYQVRAFRNFSSSRIYSGYSNVANATTQSLPSPPSVTVDVTANGLDGPITVAYNSVIPVRWVSSGAISCSVSPLPPTPPTAPATTGSFTTDPLTVAVTYTVTCINGSVLASDSVTINVLPQPPAVSVDIKANNSDGPITVSQNAIVHISWTSSASVVSCAVSPQPIPPPFPPATSGAFDTPNLTADITYTVRCVDASDFAASDSVIINVTQPPPPPSAPRPPSDLTALFVLPNHVVLNWTDNSLNEEGFRVERSSDGQTFVFAGELSSNFTSFTDIVPATFIPQTYYYRVYAFIGSSNSNYSNIADVVVNTPLPSPSNVSVITLSQIELRIRWQDNSVNEDGFSVERSLDGQSFSEIARPSADFTSFDDTRLSANTIYYYRVRTFINPSQSVYSAYSNVDSGVTLPPPGAPATPTNLTATAISGTQIALAWEDNASNEDGYAVEWSIDNQIFQPITILSADFTSFADAGLDPGNRYYYRVRSFIGNNFSGYSNSANATTLIPPEAPFNLVAEAISATRITLNWQNTVSNIEDGFKIERGLNDHDFFEIGTVARGSQAFNDPTVSPVTAYYYRVRAFNGGGNSGYTNVAQAITLPPPSSPSPAPSPPPPGGGGGGGGPSGPNPQPNPQPAPPGRAGDLNHDQQVNIFDLSLLLSRWGTHDVAADLNHDTRVDIFDLSLLLSYWLR